MPHEETDGWNVMEFSPVSYIDHMGSDDAVCDAARVSFNKTSSNYTDDQNSRLLNFLAEHDHWSPFAHCFVKFKFRAPMFVARQFQKHVVGFYWNEVSRRYVSDRPWFYIPTAWRKRPDSMKQGSSIDGQIPVKGDIKNEYIV